MKHRDLEIRLQELEQQQAMLKTQIDEAKAGEADKSMIGELMTKWVDVTARMNEIGLWQEADAKNPGYGIQIRVDGMWRPKLPEFGSIEVAIAAMQSPDGGSGLTQNEIWAARAFRAAEDAQETVKSLDGRSPFIPEEERKKFNTTL